MTGTIRAIKDRGYGFIRPEKSASPSAAAEIFFHSSDLDASLEFSEQLLERRVRFEVVTRDNKMRAKRETHRLRWPIGRQVAHARLRIWQFDGSRRQRASGPK
jgi:cold shock CspA family protein